MSPAGVAAAAEVAGTVGNIFGSSWAAKKNTRAAEKHARKSIRWRVSDAKYAGIHPLYALGAQTSSPGTVAFAPDTSGIGRAGQQVAESARRHQDAEINQAVMARENELHELERARRLMELENMAAQARSTQADADYKDYLRAGGVERIPMYQDAVMPDGTTKRIISDKVSHAYEDLIPFLASIGGREGSVFGKAWQTLEQWDRDFTSSVYSLGKRLNLRPGRRSQQARRRSRIGDR